MTPCVAVLLFIRTLRGTVYTKSDPYQIHALYHTNTINKTKLYDLKRGLRPYSTAHDIGATTRFVSRPTLPQPRYFLPRRDFTRHDIAGNIAGNGYKSHWLRRDFEVASLPIASLAGGIAQLQIERSISGDIAGDIVPGKIA